VRLGGRPIRDGLTESRVEDEPTTCIRVLRSDRTTVVGQHAHSLRTVHYSSLEERHVFDKVYYEAVEKTDFQTIAVEVLTKLGDFILREASSYLPTFSLAELSHKNPRSSDCDPENGCGLMPTSTHAKEVAGADIRSISTNSCSLTDPTCCGDTTSAAFWQAYFEPCSLWPTEELGP